MACPNCDHTLQCLYADKTLKRHWCPRCGTIRNELKREDGTVDVEADTPALVKRCRHFEPTLPLGTFGAVWVEMGIAESINPPEARLTRESCSGPDPKTAASSTSPGATSSGSGATTPAPGSTKS